jgi:hypothetical protein
MCYVNILLVDLVRESYEEKDVYHLEAIYGLLILVFVGHVECPVTDLLVKGE